MSYAVRVRGVERTRLLRWIVLTAVLLALFACSTVKVAYNNIDLYLLWKAEDYFALDSGQRAQLKAELAALAAWHRSEELGSYTAVLEDTRERVGSAIGETDIEWLLSSARLRYEVLARHIASRAAAVLTSLSPAQLARFEAKLQRENEEFAAAYVDVSPEMQRRQRFERTVELMEEWVGSLSDVQRTRMEQLSFDLPLTSGLRNADRQRRQQALVALLKQHRTSETLAPALEVWMIAWDQGRTHEYEAVSGEARRRTVAMVLELERSLSPTQRSRLQSKLGRYAREFESLATARAVGPTASHPAALRTVLETR
jgi:hypothetical protein